MVQKTVKKVRWQDKSAPSTKNRTIWKQEKIKKTSPSVSLPSGGTKGGRSPGLNGLRNTTSCGRTRARRGPGCSHASPRTSRKLCAHSASTPPWTPGTRPLRAGVFGQRRKRGVWEWGGRNNKPDFLHTLTAVSKATVCPRWGAAEGPAARAPHSSLRQHGRSWDTSPPQRPLCSGNWYLQIQTGLERDRVTFHQTDEPRRPGALTLWPPGLVEVSPEGTHRQEKQACHTGELAQKEDRERGPQELLTKTQPTSALGSAAWRRCGQSLYDKDSLASPL